MPERDGTADEDAPAPDAEQAPAPPRQKVDPKDYQQRVDRISELFSSMMETATEVSTRRCPYKNRHDECTANFGCRNQRKPEVEGKLMSCAGDDALDYRGAWEST